MTARNEKSWEAKPALPPGFFVDGAVYTDEGLFAEEQRAIFARVWQFVAHESELPAAYDYRLFTLAGRNCFAVRGGDGIVRAFINACAHRGARLLSEPSGHAKDIVCFYHRWRYNALGECTGIARGGGYGQSGVARETMGLRQIRIEAKFGLLFACLDDEAPALDAYLGGALDSFARALGETPLEVFHFSRATIAANWKSWHETNLDLYHEFMHVVLRKTQMNAVPMESRRMQVFENGHGGGGGLKADYSHYTPFSGREETAAAPLPGLTATDFAFVDLFPSTAIVVRGTVVRIDVAIPVAPDRMIVEFRGLGIKGDSEAARLERVRHHNQYWGPFGRNVPEDLFAAEACAEGFKNGAARYEIIARAENLSGQDDALLRGFWAEWSRRLGRAAHDPFGSP
jgi:methanesulfonate monooxygenase large subunit